MLHKAVSSRSRHGIKSSSSNILSGGVGRRSVFFFLLGGGSVGQMPPSPLTTLNFTNTSVTNNIPMAVGSQSRQR